MKTVIIRYNAGNIGSVQNALRRLGSEPEVTDDPRTIRAADKVIFPGVGEASTTMSYLRPTGLDRLIPELRQPVLGICLGMQLMCRWSEEGDTPGMGLFQEPVRRFRVDEKTPHMGWNSVRFTPADLFAGLDNGCFFYFIHSFYAETGERTIAYCDYGIEFSAALRRDNFYATQFHPEKSGETGLQLLKNFLEL